MDSLPNGKTALGVACPHCQHQAIVEHPSEDHKGQIKAECGNCGQAFTFASPHGDADTEPGAGDVTLAEQGGGSDQTG